MTRWSAARAPIAALLGAGLLAVAVTAEGFAAGLPLGEGTVDAHGTWWFQWWVADALDAGAPLTRAPALFHPFGKEVLVHTGGNLLDALLVAPARLVGGGAFAWNALYVLVIFANAAAVGLAAARGGIAFALVGALAGGLHPFLLHELGQGRPTQAIIAPLVASLVLGDAGLRRGGAFRLGVAGGLLALQGFFYWFSAGFGALALLACAFAAWRSGRGAAAVARRLAGLLALAALAAAPLAAPLALATLNGATPGFLDLSRLDPSGAAWTREGDKVLLTVLDAGGHAGIARPDGFASDGPALGVAALATVLLAPGRWRAVGLLALAVALGPFVAGLPNPVWYALSALPPFARLWWPVRALALFVPIAAIALARLSSGRAPPPLRSPGLRHAALALLATALLAEPLLRGLVPLGRWSPTPPSPVVATLGAVPTRAAVVLPLGGDHEHLLYQAATGAPLFNGMYEHAHAFVPGELVALRADNTLLVALETALRDPRARVEVTPADRDALRALDYGWIVVRKRFLGAPDHPRARDVRRRLETLLGRPVVEDELVAVWPLR